MRSFVYTMRFLSIAVGASSFCFVAAVASEGMLITSPAPEASEDKPQLKPILRPIRRQESPARILVNDASAMGSLNERLIYSSTLGRFAYAPGANVLIADDISTTAAPGCRLSRYSVEVTGRVDEQLPGGPYSVNLALYSLCPYSRPAYYRPPWIIPGTATTVELGDSGPATIEVLIPPEYGSIPNHLWLAVSFSRANAGLILGGLPEEGYSTELFDTPGNACRSTLGTPGPRATFNANLWGDGCDPVHFGYLAHAEAGVRATSYAGDRVITDDLHLIHDDCLMIGMNVVVQGPGTYTFELRRTCDDHPIEGTRFSRVLSPTHGPYTRVISQIFDSPIELPQAVWFSAIANNLGAGMVLSNRAADVGYTSDTLGAQTALEQCRSGDLYSVYDAMSVTIICQGAAEIGACCDATFVDEHGHSVCREVARMNCPDPDFWHPGATCSSSCAGGQNDDQPCDGSDDCPEGVCAACAGLPPCALGTCCEEVCSHTELAHCCDTSWDAACDQAASADCIDPPNDECASASGQSGAENLFVPDKRSLDLSLATSNPVDPGFCCHNDDPGASGLGTLWYRFEAPQPRLWYETKSSVNLQLTAVEGTPTGGGLLQVFEKLGPLEGECADGSSCESPGKPCPDASKCMVNYNQACGSLHSIGCTGSGELCLRRLTPGQTYFIAIAAESPEFLGKYNLLVRSDCDQVSSSGVDCNLDGTPDICELPPFNPGGDCNSDLVSDKCELDCDDNGVADLCETPPIGDRIDCDDNGAPDACQLWYPKESGVQLPAFSWQYVPLPQVAGTSAVICAGNQVHVFRRVGEQWVPQSSPPPLQGDIVSCSFDGTRIAVTERRPPWGTHYVRVFRAQGGEWIDEGTFILNFHSDHAVSIDKNVLIIGTPFTEGEKDCGAAYVFRFNDAAGWLQEAVLPPQVARDDEICEQQGRRVRIQGNRAAISGLDYVEMYESNGDEWFFKGRVTQPDGAHLFDPLALALDGDRVAFGDLNVNDGNGGIHIYKFNGVTYLLEQTVAIPETDQIGETVALQGNLLLVGSKSPVIYAFVNDGETWRYHGRISAVGHITSLAMSNDTFVSISYASEMYTPELFRLEVDHDASAIMDSCQKGDIDASGQADSGDWAALTTCMRGPCGDALCLPLALSDQCPLLDNDDDGAVDLRDVAFMQRAFATPVP